jgi:hypothetical protein
MGRTWNTIPWAIITSNKQKTQKKPQQKEECHVSGSLIK